MGLSQEQSEELLALFKQAEEAVSLMEAEKGGVIIPAINQLRYAGRHILDALAYHETSDENFRRARRHCQRAIYDAYDSGIMFLIERIASFRDDYNKITITPFFPEYRMVISRSREALNFLNSVRSETKDRSIFYQQAVDIFKELKPLCDTMEDSREELNKEVKKHNTASLHQSMILFLTIATVCLTVVGFLR